MAQQCFCGCGRKLRFTKARASSFGRSVADRTHELADAKDRVSEEHAPIFADMVQLGKLLARRWEPVAHSERLITGEDRIDTEAFLQSAKQLLAFSRLDPAAQRDTATPVEAAEVKSWLVTEVQRVRGGPVRAAGGSVARAGGPSAGEAATGRIRRRNHVAGAR